MPLFQALLDLGGSPNYKDRRGLTPLFHTAMVGGDPRCCELLLYNRAQLGIADENGWQEIHQVSGIQDSLGAETGEEARGMGQMSRTTDSMKLGI